MVHLMARTEKPTIYPNRFPVSEGQTPWEINFPEYDPAYFVAPSVLKNHKPGGWADPEDLAMINHPYHSYTGDIQLDKNCRPLNPYGRSGIVGRGLLGKWGANFAADPIITRINPETDELEMIAIERADCGKMAIPGGMVDEGESITSTLSREFTEEAGAELDMSDATEVYRGYADDRRNTDNAWIETVAKHKHLDPKTASDMTLQAGDDAMAVRWLPLNVQNVNDLYGGHPEMIKEMLRKFIQTNPDLPPKAQMDIAQILNS